jgi:hypothetical protein
MLASDPSFYQKTRKDESEESGFMKESVTDKSAIFLGTHF